MELKEEFAAVEGLTPELIEKIIPLVQTHKDNSFSAGVGKAYQEFEDKTKSIFGIEKEDREKATLYLERAYGLHRKGLESDFERKHLEPRRKELSDLKEKLGKGISDEKLKQEFEELKGIHTKTSTDFEEFKKQTEKEKSDLIRDWQIKAELKGIKFSSKDGEYVKFKTENFIKSLKSEFEIVETDKGLLFKGGKDHGYKDYTLDELTSKYLGDLIEKENTGNAGNGTGSVNSDSLSSLISSTKTKGEALEMIKQSLISEGLSFISDEWGKKFSERQAQYQKELNSIK